MAGIFISVYRFLRLDKVIKALAVIISNFGILGKRLLLFNSLATKTKIKQSTDKNIHKNKTAIYFEGCFNEHLNSETKEAVEKILLNSDITLIEKDFECCGVSYINDGNIVQFKKLLNKNLEKLDCAFDYLITDCASCCNVLKDYRKFSDIPVAEDFESKIVSVTELLSSFKFESKTDLKIAIHKPCHEEFDFIGFVKNIKNINFVEIEDYDKCCGFSGKFALQNSAISRKISKEKAQKYIDGQADIILTTCPACLLGLNQGLIETKNIQKPLVMNLFVFLAVYCEQI